MISDVRGLLSTLLPLIRWGLIKMADILQTTFSNALSLNKCWCLHSRISLIFVPEGLIDKYWTNCERTIPVVKGNLPGAAQYRPKGNCISVWFWHIYIYIYIYMFTRSIHLTNLIPGTGGVYILIDQLPQWGPWKHGVVATRMYSVP